MGDWWCGSQVNFIVTPPKSSPPPPPPTMNNDRSIMAPLYISAGSYQYNDWGLKLKPTCHRLSRDSHRYIPLLSCYCRLRLIWIQNTFLSRFNYRGNTLLPYAALFVTLGQESGSSLLSGRYLLFTSPLGRSDSNIVPTVLLLRPLRKEEGFTVNCTYSLCCRYVTVVRVVPKSYRLKVRPRSISKEFSSRVIIGHCRQFQYYSSNTICDLPTVIKQRDWTRHYYLLCMWRVHFFAKFWMAVSFTLVDLKFLVKQSFSLTL